MRYGHIVRIGSLAMNVGIPSQQCCIEKSKEFVFGLVGPVRINALGFHTSSILDRRGFGYHRRFS